MGRLKQYITLGIITASLVTLSQGIMAYAATNIIQTGCDNTNSANSSICASATKDNAQSMVQIVINILFIILGIISVVMIVTGGLRYVLSNGDANAIKGAKNTILYAVIGLIIAILSFAIVNFVLAKLK